MSKWLVLPVFTFAFLFLLAINVVSATHNTYGYLGSGLGYGGYGGYGGGYGGYGYLDGYRDYDYYGCDGGYGYGGYGDCYRTETFRDTTESRHTTTSTFRDRYTTERTKTVTTSYTDIQRETRTPIYAPRRSSFYSYGAFYPSRTVIGCVDGYRRYPYYDSYRGYYDWRYRC